MNEFLGALEFVLSWPTIGLLALVVTGGLIIGVIPGLGGVVGLTILLPILYDVDFRLAVVLMVALLAATVTSDSSTAILLGVPGSSGSQATIIDGRAMSRLGQAPRALGAAYGASFIGGLIGAGLLALSVPLMRPVVLAFGPPELLVLGLWGLSLVATLSAGVMAKGMAVTCLGLLLSTVGRGPKGGELRFVEDITWLWDGLPIVPIALGIFAVPELIEVLARDKAVKGGRLPPLPVMGDAGIRGQIRGVRDALRHWRTVVQSSAVGMWVGVIPGVGSSISDWFAYALARQSAGRKGRFGRGDVRGVIAPEASANASRGGDLIPMLAFGVPGSAPTAILLGAFIVAGVTPGRSMLTENVDITYSLVWALALANVIGTVICLLASRYLARLPYMSGRLLILLVVPIVITASYASAVMIEHLWLLAIFSLVGLAMKRYGWPRPPLLLAFVLGPIVERNLGLTIQLFGLSALLRPGTLVLLVLMIATFVLLVMFRSGGREMLSTVGARRSPDQGEA